MGGDLDDGFAKAGLAAGLGHPGAASDFHAALRGVAAEHGREVHRMEAEMAELRELVTHLQGLSVAQEVKSMRVEVSMLDGSPMKVETVLADGRKFMTLEPPELVEQGFVSEGSSRNASAESDTSQNGCASPTSVQALRAAMDKGGEPAGNGVGDDQGMTSKDIRISKKKSSNDPWHDRRLFQEKQQRPLPEEDSRASAKSNSDPFSRALPVHRRGISPMHMQRAHSNGAQRSSDGPKVSPSTSCDVEREDFMVSMETANSMDDSNSPKARSSRAPAFTRARTATMLSNTSEPSHSRLPAFTRARTATMLSNMSAFSRAPGFARSRTPTTLTNSTDQSRTSRRLAKEQAEFETQGQRRWRERREAYNKRSQSVFESWGSLRRNGSLGLSVRLIVHHWSFDCLCGLIICANAVLIGVSTQHIARHAGTDKLEYEIAGLFCNVFFLLELLMRMYDERIKFFTSEGWRWNTFDTLLVGLSGVDAIIQYGYDSDVGSLGQRMKTIKMLRIVRVCRVFRFFSELRLLALMILDCFKSLAWALAMLGLIMYVFAVVFTQDVAVHLSQFKNVSSQSNSVLAEHFGDIFSTLTSLLHSILNGISWHILTTALQYNPAMTALFFFYISFVVVAVLNIITGVFVNEAVQTTLSQREFLVEKQIRQKRKWCREMRELFQALDKEGHGGISLEVIQDCLGDACVESYFQALGLEPHDAQQLFFALDRDLSGEVSLDEFLEGCLRLKGEARSIDVYSVMQEVRTLSFRFDDLAETFRKDVAVALGVQEPDQKEDPPGPDSKTGRQWATWAQDAGLSKVAGKGADSPNVASLTLPEPFEEEDGTVVMFPEPVEEDVPAATLRHLPAAGGTRINGTATRKTAEENIAAG